MEKDSLYQSSSAVDLGSGSAKMASLILIGKLFSLAVNGLAIIIIARLLGLTGFGVYTLALGVVGFFQAFGNLSIGPYLNSIIPKLLIEKKFDKVSKVIGSSVFVLIILDVILTIVAVLLTNFIAINIFHNPASESALFAGAFLIAAGIINVGAYYTLIAFGDGERATISSMVTNFFEGVSSVVLIILGYGPLGAIVGMLIGLVLGTIVSVIFILKHTKIELSLKPVKEEIDKYLAFTIPISGANVITNAVTNFGVIFLGALFIPAIAGLYGASVKMLSLLDIIVGSIALVIVPMFSAALTNSKLKEQVGEFYSYAIYFGFLLATPVIMFIVSLRVAFTVTVFSAQYVTGANYVALVSLSVLLSIAYRYAYSMIVASGKVKKVLKYAFISNLIQLILIFILVPMYGALGLITALYIVGGIITCYFYLNYVQNEMKISLHANLTRLSVANVLLLFLLSFVGSSTLPLLEQLIVGGIITVLTYPAFLGVVGAVNKDTISLLRSANKRVNILRQLPDLVISYQDLFVR